MLESNLNLGVATAIALVTQTMSSWSDVLAIALVGSYARGTARLDSDIDLIILVDRPELYRTNQSWLEQIAWNNLGTHIQAIREQDYGPVWSCFVTLHSGLEIECGFSSPHWAATNPIDPGTAQVVSDGCHILYDPHRIFNLLLDHLRGA